MAYFIFPIETLGLARKRSHEILSFYYSYTWLCL